MLVLVGGLVMIGPPGTLVLVAARVMIGPLVPRSMMERGEEDGEEPEQLLGARPKMATASLLAADLNAGASLSSSSSSLQNGANGALRDEVKRLSQRVDVLTSEKAVLAEQQAQLLGEAETLSLIHI